MGFTRYWTTHKAISEDKMRKIASDIRCMLKEEEAWGTVVRWECDSEKVPLCNKNGLRFNGIGNDGHETFAIFPDTASWDFCKTARKEYDKYVLASLLIIGSHVGREYITFESDGHNASDGEAYQLYEKYSKGKFPLVESP